MKGFILPCSGRLVFYRTVAFLCGVLAVVLAAWNTYTYVNMKKTVLLYSASATYGLSTEKLNDREYFVPEKCIEDQIYTYIEHIRTVEKSRKKIRTNWIAAHDIATPQMGKKMAKLYSSWDPEQTAKEYIVYTTPVSCRRRSEDYEVIWKEFCWDSVNNRYMTENYYRALVGVVIRQPETEVDIRKNPLGIYIDSIGISLIKGDKL